MKFLRCSHCGNIVEVVKDAGVPMMCCGQKMGELIAGTTDAAVEKHVPLYTVEGNIVTVNVGEVTHPMSEEHFIEWVAIETTAGVQRKAFVPTDKPVAQFALADGETVTAVYAYCNLHSLWKA